MGMFNTRERVELVVGQSGVSDIPGILLCRDIMAPLHTCENWNINPETLVDNEDGYIWLNGRSSTDFSNLHKSLTSGADKVIIDDHGLVAAHLSSENSIKLFKHWVQWKNETFPSKNMDAFNSLEVLDLSPSEKSPFSALGYIWDLVPATADILDDDLKFLSTDQEFSRHPFGLFAENKSEKPIWDQPTVLREAVDFPDLRDRLTNKGKGVWLGDDVHLAVGAALDTSKGPIILDNNVEVMPHCFLEGPLYAGPGCRFKAGSTIYGESSFGIGNRLSGEIGESTFGDFANKQHDGFIGHAVLGSWTNLGAMTTCSDLKNNYGNVRVDIGSGQIDSRLRFVGLLMGDHVKTAIGTLFNTGTTVGFASNIFGGVMPPKFVGSFSWGGMPDDPAYDVEKALETAVIVMGRRGCRMTEEAKSLIRSLA